MTLVMSPLQVLCWHKGDSTKFFFLFRLKLSINISTTWNGTTGAGMRKTWTD